ncbi:MarR family winged helix-turn-helix transcriptional regulator [Sinimarinibacterium sp. NLF-5-8]|uniref:MarR family winged helix-turn-helix transcriptional regulator n=1 Tax=Sinimarinibacterium sp. NLF-5-8 TaxID=2698684 RepID=UPI00137BF862|nr:winged helix DNA-binding protein [Sinimarinibacterium sp. NLF-5-8]QHS10305.1 winged helix DNA-binding protein [Sinimarinibacterium sp. NLF-5-8]
MTEKKTTTASKKKVAKIKAKNTLPDNRLLKHHSEFMGFFYKVHYQLGMALEAAMCHGVVSHTQGAVLWLVASEVGPDGKIMRKQIEQSLREWYETSNSNVSKMLRDLARPPLNFLTQEESPHSGREKVITLTSEGAAFVEEMRRRGTDYLEQALTHMSADEMSKGVDFFAALFSKPVVKAAIEQEPVPARRGGGYRRRSAAV